MVTDYIQFCVHNFISKNLFSFFLVINHKYIEKEEADQATFRISFMDTEENQTNTSVNISILQIQEIYIGYDMI